MRDKIKVRLMDCIINGIHDCGFGSLSCGDESFENVCGEIEWMGKMWLPGSGRIENWAALFFLGDSDSDGTQTHDLQNRNLTLYSTELRSHFGREVK